MSNSPTSSTKFWALTAVTLAAAACALAALVTPAMAAARTESVALMTRAQADRGEAAADYQLALWLNPSNNAARLGLAAAQLAISPTAALKTLTPAGQGSNAIALRVRALIETGQTSAGASAAGPLVAAAPSDSNLTLAALAYSVAGQTTAAMALTAHTSSPQAAQAIQRAAAGHLPLAAELYATGLLNSSSAILAKLPVGYERNLLLAHIDYDHGDRANLTAATNLLQAADAISPANLEARQLLVAVDQARGDSATAKAQLALIAKLEAGRP